MNDHRFFCGIGLLMCLWIGCFSGCANTEIGNPEVGAVFAMPDEGAVDAYLRAEIEADIDAAAGNDEVNDPGSAIPPRDAGPQGNSGETGGGDMVAVRDDVFFHGSSSALRVLVREPSGTLTIAQVMEMDAPIEALFLYENTLAVVVKSAVSSPAGERIGVLLFDVSDPAVPMPVRDLRLDGALSAARAIDGRLILVQHYLPDLPVYAAPWQTSPADSDALTEESRQDLAALPLASLLPSLLEKDSDTGAVIQTISIPPARTYRPETADGALVTTMTAIDLARPADPARVSAYIGAVDHGAVTASAVYLIRRDPSESSSGETRIHRFSATDGSIAYTGTGRISGRITGPEALAETENGLFIRAAVTDAAGLIVDRLYGLAFWEPPMTVVSETMLPIRFSTDVQWTIAGDAAYLFAPETTGPSVLADLSDVYHPVAARFEETGGAVAGAAGLPPDRFVRVSHRADALSGAPTLWLTVLDALDVQVPWVIDFINTGIPAGACRDRLRNPALRMDGGAGFLSLPVCGMDGTLSRIAVFRIAADNEWETTADIHLSDTAFADEIIPADQVRTWLAGDDIYIFAPVGVVHGPAGGSPDQLRALFF